MNLFVLLVQLATQIRNKDWSGAFSTFVDILTALKQNPPVTTVAAVAPSAWVHPFASSDDAANAIDAFCVGHGYSASSILPAPVNIDKQKLFELLAKILPLILSLI